MYKCIDDTDASSFLGTRGYLAPEMLQRREYNRAVDSWALGVIVFVLLCGCLPFDDDPSLIPTDDAVRSKFTLRFPRWARDLSPSAKDLLAHLLDINPRRRYTAGQALNHPWVKGSTAPKDSMLHSPGRIILTPGKGSKNGSSTTSAVAANRTHMNKMIASRARANSNPRPPGRHLVRKKSI